MTRCQRVRTAGTSRAMNIANSVTDMARASESGMARAAAAPITVPVTQPSQAAAPSPRKNAGVRPGWSEPTT